MGEALVQVESEDPQQRLGANFWASIWSPGAIIV